MKHCYLKKWGILCVFILTVSYSFAQVPSYYNGTDISKTGNELKTNLATLIQQGTTGSYSPGVWNALKQTDLDPTNSNNVLLIYGYNDNDGSYKTDRTRGKDLNGGVAGTQWNREHSYPKSLGQPNLGTSGPGADIHHLRASDISMNSSRGSKPYIDVAGGGNARAFNNGWYPGDEWKGDVARMMMYMYLRYGERCNINRVGSGSNTFNAEIPDIFLKWNAEDPVSQYELNRNAIVEGIQGNRNPFIDNPAFATSIWGGPQAENRFNGGGNTDTQAPTTPSNLVATNTTETQTELTWSASTDNVGVLAYQIFNGATQVASTNTTSYTVTGLTANTSYTFTVKAIDAASNVSTASNAVSVTTSNIVTPPNNGNTIYYQGYEGTSNDNWTYTVSPTSCNNGGDVWSIVDRVGSISTADAGTKFFGVRDLEGNCGTSAGGTITLNNVDVSTFKDVELSFKVNVVGYDVNNGDTISYEIILNGNAQAAKAITTSSPFSTSGWEKIKETIPSGTTTVGLKINVKQNGGKDYAGFDAIQLQGTAIVTTPNIIINEIDADQSGTDSNEFIELYDGGTGNTALDGLVVVLYNGSNDQSYNTIDLTGLKTNANGYFVIGSATVPNVDLVKFTTNGLQNGADAVALYSASASNFPNGTAVTTDNLVDAIVYDTNDGDDAGLSVLLNANEPQVNEGGKGNKDGHSLQRSPNGEGGARNTSSFTQLVPTPGAENVAVIVTPPTANIVINEVDADTSGSDTAEFVELFDGGTGNTALDGFVIVMYNGSNNTVYGAYDLDGKTTNAEGYFVLGNSGVANATMTLPSNGLQNGADAVALYKGNASDFVNGSAVTTTNLIDALVYDTNDGDDAELLVLLNIGQAQINEDEKGDKDNHSNQRVPNGQGGARNTSTYTQATPTPGAKNGEPVIVTPTEPISIADARAKADGEEVMITGTLTVSDQFRGSAYIQDATGGIAIFDKLVHGDDIFKIGDSITVTAKRSTYRDQVQLGNVTKVENHGVANNPITPKTVTLSQLGNYAGQLVRVENPSFAKPGDMLFGNSNYEVTDASGNGQLRIDLDVDGLPGLAQPQTCSEVIGVVGRFNTTFQLLPRLKSDMACATKYEAPSSQFDAISKDNTLDVVTWNIEWFGDEDKSPASGNANSDLIQKDSVKTVLKSLNADVIAVQEIVDVPLFTSLISELPEYGYILSDATSYPNDTDGVSQKIGFIYRKATVNVKKTEAMLKSIHPYYNGGNSSAIQDFPNTDKSRFYASGRLPFLMTADVTVNGTKEEYNFVALHARANNNRDAQNRYNMRKYDVEVLKDSLDARFPTANVVLLGDYNDDIDETVVADKVSNSTTTYDVFVKDTANYTIASKSLTYDGFRSFVFVENMIDHITLSNELNDNYLTGSERVHYEFYNNFYSRTTSDHFPVSVRLQLKTLEITDSSSTNASCNGTNDGTATITVSGGIAPYNYSWSNGNDTNSVSELTAGEYTVIVTDALGNTVNKSFTIEEPTAIELTTTDDTKVFLGYWAEECTDLEVLDIKGGKAPYTYKWSTGETEEAIFVCPYENTTYTVTVTDANGCSVSKDINVQVEDVACGNGWFNKVQVCYKGRLKCVSEYAAERLLERGAVLGSCNNADEAFVVGMKAYPNPFRNFLNVKVATNKDATVEVALYSYYGRKVFSAQEDVLKGETKLKYNLKKLRGGMYYLKTFINGEQQRVKAVYKYHW